MSTGLRRTGVAVTAGLMAAGLLISGGAMAGAAGAAPKPTLSQVQARLAKLNTQAQVLDQRFDAAQQQLKAASQRLKFVNAEAVRYRGTFEKMRTQVARIAAQAYENGQLTSSAALFTSDDPQQVLDQGSILLELSSSNSAQMTRYIAAARQLTSAQQSAQHARASIVSLRNGLTKQRATLTKVINQQEALAKQLTPVQRAPTGPGGGNGGSGGGGSPSPPPTPPPGSGGGGSAQAQQAVAFAYAQLGKPYVFGASGPSSYDCSGLTMASWASAGVTIPRTSEEQWAGLPHVSTSALEPGDILVFNGAGHVGIYVGDNMMIDAPHTGLDVEKVALSGWYRATLDGAVRP